jgi:hypothetical protein
MSESDRFITAEEIKRLYDMGMTLSATNANRIVATLRDRERLLVEVEELRGKRDLYKRTMQGLETAMQQGELPPHARFSAACAAMQGNLACPEVVDKNAKDMAAMCVEQADALLDLLAACKSCGGTGKLRNAAGGYSPCDMCADDEGERVYDHAEVKLEFKKEASDGE